MYNVENILLCGDISLDRTKNLDKDEYLIENETSLLINGQSILGKQYSAKNINGKQYALVVMRLHFMVHTYLNLTIQNSSKEVLYGH